MSEKDIQDALQFADSIKTSGIHLYDDIRTLASAYRQKCEEYNRLLEVAETMSRILVCEVDWDECGETLEQFEELLK